MPPCQAVDHDDDDKMTRMHLASSTVCAPERFGPSESTNPPNATTTDRSLVGAARLNRNTPYRRDTATTPLRLRNESFSILEE